VHKRLDSGFNKWIGDGDLDFQLRQKTGLNLGSSVNFRVTALPAAPTYFCYRHQVHVNAVESYLYGLETLRSNNRNNQFHVSCLPVKIG
jgi:hypothetical protein